MQGLFEHQIQSLQWLHPVIDYIIWGVILGGLIGFCWVMFKKYKNEEVDEEENIEQYRENKRKMGI